MSSVRTIIRGVRDLSPHFDERRVPNAVLMRAFARYQDQVLGRISDSKRDALDRVETLSLATFNWTDGWANVSDVIEYYGGRVTFTDTTRAHEPFRLVPYEHRFDTSTYRWAGYIQGRSATVGYRLWLLGIEADWTGVASILLDSVARVLVPLTTLDSVFELPIDHDDVLVAWGAVVAASRCRQLNLDVDPAEFEEAWAVAEERYLDRVTGRRKPKYGVATEVW